MKKYFIIMLCLIFLFTSLSIAFAQTTIQTNHEQSVKKLHLSQTDKKIAGVCGGLGEYFNVDPIIFRVLFGVSALCGGIGIPLYLVMWYAMS